VSSLTEGDDNMKRRVISSGSGAVFSFLVLILLALSFPIIRPAPVAATVPLPPTYGWTQVVENGFTDPGNTHVPFVAEFHGQLYVTTTASQAGELYSGSTKLGGDIWRTTNGVEWEQIGTPGLGNKNNFMFDLVVFKDRLYAISYNHGDEGLEVWVTSDGTDFTKVQGGGFGDPDNDHAVPFVFADRLILLAANSTTGVQVWVSEDGESFQRVVDGGLGIPGTTGAVRCADPMDPPSVFEGMLYVGISNTDAGGEIWRTADGVDWERVAHGGLGRVDSIALALSLVYKDQLYAVGSTGGTLEDLAGFELFRTSDGTDWEKVVEDGFSMGVERNIGATLTEFERRLYLTTSNMDPRLLVPDHPSERHPPEGFQLWVSNDGSQWTQVGNDGFGMANSYVAGAAVIDDTLYLEAYDYHVGNTLWKSADGTDWQMVFQDPETTYFTGGGGVMELQGHLLWISADLQKGLEIWRTDDVVVASSDDTSDESSTTTEATGAGETDVSTDGGETVTGEGGLTGGEDGNGGSSDESDGKDGGLSGAWIAIIAVLAVIAAAGIGTTAYLLGRLRRPELPPAPPAGTGTAGTGTAGTGTTGAGTVGTGTHGAQSAQVGQTQAGAGFCAGCGSPVNPDMPFCAQCGRRYGE